MGVGDRTELVRRAVSHLVVIADPEPIKRVPLTKGQRSISIRDSCAPEIARGVRFQRSHSLPWVLPSDMGRNDPVWTWALTFSTIW